MLELSRRACPYLDNINSPPPPFTSMKHGAIGIYVEEGTARDIPRCAPRPIPATEFATETKRAKKFFARVRCQTAPKRGMFKNIMCLDTFREQLFADFLLESFRREQHFRKKCARRLGESKISPRRRRCAPRPIPATQNVT